MEEAPACAAELDLFDASATPCDVQMPLSTDLSGLVGEAAPVVQTLAAEWNAPLVWPAAWGAAWLEHGNRVVHAWHDLRVHRRLPQRCRLSATVVAQRPTRAGALTVVRYDGADDDGPVWTSFAGALWRGLGVVAKGHADEPAVQGTDEAGVTVRVGEDLARRYSEASGIWNPIHTDPAAARAAGLAAPILHGSATLALALSTVGLPSDLERVQVRFLAPVAPPDVLDIAASTMGQQLDGEVRRSDRTVVIRFRAHYRPAQEKENA